MISDAQSKMFALCGPVIIVTISPNMVIVPGVSGPDNDRTIFPTSLCGPKISGPENDQIV